MRLGKLGKILAGALLLLLPLGLVMADRQYTILASAARTAAGTGSAIDMTGVRQAFVHVNVTAGSGTVTVFRVWLDASGDNGTTWTELLCDTVLETGVAAPGGGTANQRDIINKVAVLTSGNFTCELDNVPTTIRPEWNITGTTPSETFSIMATAK